MRFVVHKADDALYLRLDESAIAESEEANRILDFRFWIFDWGMGSDLRLLAAANGKAINLSQKSKIFVSACRLACAILRL
ncbi:MAG: hypothetical protein AAFX78_17335 [Cyanobacteria bacterium J06638_20]